MEGTSWKYKVGKGGLWLALRIWSCELLNSRAHNCAGSRGSSLGRNTDVFPALVPLRSLGSGHRRDGSLRLSWQPKWLSGARLPVPHLAGNHLAISATDRHTVAIPKPESSQPLGPERCPVHEMPSHPQTLQTVSHISQRSFFSLLTPPPAFSSSTSFDGTFWHCFASESVAVPCSWLQRNLPSKGKAHTRLQKVSRLAFLIAWSELDSTCRVDGLYIDDPFYAQFRHLCWDFFLILF